MTVVLVLTRCTWRLSWAAALSGSLDSGETQNRKCLTKIQLGSDRPVVRKWSARNHSDSVQI